MTVTRLYWGWVVLLCQTGVWADEPWHFAPKIYTAYRNFDYTAGVTGVEGHVLSLGFGLTTTHKNFYSHVFTEKNLRPTEERTTNLVANTVTFERKDSSLSFGYALNPTLSVFSGYKIGETAITALNSSDLRGNFIRLNAKGPFVGAGAAWPIGGGMLSFSAGFAWMRASYKQSNIPTTRGNATGASLSLHWKAPLKDRWAYEIGLFRHSYFYDKLDRSEGSINEHIFSIRTGLSYQF